MINKVEKLKKRAKKFIKEKKVLVESCLLALGLLIAQATPVLADINGETIKNNLVNNFFQPIYIVIMGFLLLKEFAKKSLGAIIITILIGGIIGIFIFAPEAINTIINTLKGLVGM